ncbi:glucocorticoid-induced transcript 1 protein [Triplophysa dalaica]|uniref:glucocorticoid-induced transcript 1 protein n=1 Tax=Triplophysa dalaica TaxID=1582913 RepID=UPI0024DF6513|nr:glucocorticoid-induced transcript 1 protein [Triplophysa dalaica]
MRSPSFCFNKHHSSSPSYSSDAVDMKQLLKATRMPTESHLKSGGRARSASRQPISLDDLPEKYLMGQWPREPYHPRPSSMSDKATQTPGFWSDDGEMNIHKRSASWDSADHLMEITKLRQQLQLSLKGSRSVKEKEDVTSTQPTQTQPKHLSASSSNPVFSRPLICRMPSNSDCINQELENVFVCENWGRKEEKALEVRDGGRAPVPPLHHSDVNPHDTEAQVSCSPCGYSSPSLDIEKDYTRDSPFPQLACSPKPNHSYTFKREPPEGCEKVKVFEDIVTCRTQGFPIFSCPDRNKVNFSPSGSAFCPVKILCSSFFPAERTARPGSLDHQNAGQTSTLFTEATAQNGFHPVPSEHCSIRKCLLLS